MQPELACNWLFQEKQDRAKGKLHRGFHLHSCLKLFLSILKWFMGPKQITQHLSVLDSYI